MKAVVLAGGRGARLAPYTTVLPKPLMPLGDKPILEIVIRQLALHGFRDISLAVGYLGELIMAFCGDGSRFGVNLSYSRESTPLGTAGPLSLLKDLGETFLLMNGDLLTSLDFTAMMEFHRSHGGVATLATCTRDVRIESGVLDFDEDRWVRSYTEKPSYRYSISTGIYVLEPEVLQHIPNNQHFDLPELVDSLLGSGQKVGAFVFDGPWLDIGRPEDYETALEVYRTQPATFLPGDSVDGQAPSSMGR